MSSVLLRKDPHPPLPLVRLPDVGTACLNLKSSICLLFTKHFNPLPNNKILEVTKLKALAYNTLDKCC